MGHNLGLQHTFKLDTDEDVENENGVCKRGNRILPQHSTKNIMDYTYDNEPDNRRFFFKYQIDHLKNK
ncbi:hypothetical protein FACS189432_08030 [Bacteroidia bacterium]|nr:hypothetical protein FACS189432_08030 [Bacteroidia bacterium]